MDMASAIQKFQTQTLSKSQPGFSVIKTDEGFELIPYNDQLTQDGIVREFKRLKAAFPGLDKSFNQILADRVTENKYTDKQLHDAINHVIDNCTYPIPTIANVMSFKNKIKLYTYSQICQKVETIGKEVWNEYKAIDMGFEKKVWVLKIDAEKYGL